eukprot:CAMPEP_0184298826 /NCGR_PEP_ID=MMETSP1049-20130417/9553_1 /TAXON_ID=77928 /ORGANISM="Proteomonas sulcata, Strain CCMP704" /LENGTH=133 /DNA_ID=CAMNT_0026609069 /DNA_START=57 /DNA_END=458 /DNA_ORIENTATION=+
MMRHVDNYDARDDEDGSKLRAHVGKRAQLSSRNSEGSPTPEPALQASLEEGYGAMGPPAWPMLNLKYSHIDAFGGSDPRLAQVAMHPNIPQSASTTEESDSWADQLAAELGSVGNAAVTLLNLQSTALTQIAA